jgi:anthranilate phosphoribosyltransferase
MLVADTIAELIAGALPEESACERLRQLASVPLTSKLLGMVVEAIKLTRAEGAGAIFTGIDGVLDCCGTGGSGMAHYNTSTTVAFVLAAGGVKVAKSGNRAANSASGSFDLLEVIGIRWHVQSEAMAEIIDKTNLAFLFAPDFYPVFKNLAAIRRAVGGRTIFNVVGPLLNPANPQFRLLGTPKANELGSLADYLATDGVTKRALIVTAGSGLDELDPGSTNQIVKVEKQSVEQSSLDASVHFDADGKKALNVEDNRYIFDEMLRNNASGYYRHLVCLNAGAGFLVSGTVKSIEEGQALADELLLSGAVLNKFEQCRRVYEYYAR